MATKKPNILVLWGDDVGWWNISYNSRGQMGYRTPNIDRVANEGVAFTDYYAQQSCTAGRAAFISGSAPIRSGMTKVGMPGAKEGWQMTDCTMATVLKSPDLRDKLSIEAIEPITMTPDEFGAFIKAEIVRWTAIAKARNIQLDN